MLDNAAAQRPLDEVYSLPDLPKGWTWFSANEGTTHYTRYFGTEYRKGGDLIGVHGSIGGFEGEVYWDEGGGGDHHVAFYPIVDQDENFDPVTAEVCLSRSYDSATEAHQAVPSLVERLKERAKDGG